MSDVDWLNPSAIEEWWATPSQRGIKRPYSADTVASLRDVFPENHHSNQMALKLRAVFDKSQKDKTPNIAMNAVDAVAAELMTEAGFETVYVSGERSVEAKVAIDGLGLDSTDHTTFVPKKVATIHRSQLLHSRALRIKKSGPEDASLLPIIADAGSGQGQHTAIMKLVKKLVQSGVAGFHLDDLLPGSGLRKHDSEDGNVTVVVPTNEYLRRLVSAKLQLDIMGSEVVTIARTDAEIATHITSTIDYRDRPFILGATVPMKTHYIHTEGNSARAEWKREAKLKTLDEAFRVAQPNLYDQFIERTKKVNVAEALAVAQKLAPDFYFDYESPRTAEGWYAYNGGIEAAIARSNNAGFISSVVWACTHSYRAESARKFASGVRAVHPGKWMAYNIAFDVGANRLSGVQLESLPQSLATMGYVWLFLPLSDLPTVGQDSKLAIKAIKEQGLGTYLHRVSTGEVRQHADGTNSEWWWKVMGKAADQAADAIGRDL
ncbi:isocitrate lyase [Kwoniella sp. CBS 9459]